MRRLKELPTAPESSDSDDFTPSMTVDSRSEGPDEPTIPPNTMALPRYRAAPQPRAQRSAKAMRKHKVTTSKKEDVKRMAGNGHTHEAIANSIKISVSTLERRYRKELLEGATEKHQAVMERLQQQAVSGSKSAPAAAQRMFLARARGFGNNLPSRMTVQHEFAGDRRPVRVLLPDNSRNPDVKLMEPGSQVQIYDPKNPPPEVLLLEGPKKPAVSED
jgi:hypothetical protein